VSSVLAKSESTPQDLFKEISRILNRLEQKEIESEKDNSEKRILVVEDNDATVIQMKAILEHENYIVEVASDGLQALEHVKHTIPDGIILDLMMPEMDGFEVLESIRSTDTTKQIPILILTAKDLTKKDLSKLSTNNVQQLVQKGDVDVDGLLLKVKMMLGNGTYEQQEDRKKGERGKPEKTGKQKKIIDGVPNILVVEDNPDNMITIKAIIGNDYNIWEAMDGEEGLHRIANDKPDLVLMDISLPKMDGMEVVTIIRETENLKDIPMIAVTAKAMKEDKDIIMNAGFDDYITKPIDQKLLLKTIKKWLGK
jgi:CheY-like chemotaxis protein